nr:hypothetical protein [uncultured Marvinbryantia sp.]
MILLKMQVSPAENITENAGVTGRKHHRKCRCYRQKTSQKIQIPSAENITENTRDVRAKGEEK